MFPYLGIVVSITLLNSYCILIAKFLKKANLNFFNISNELPKFLGLEQKFQSFPLKAQLN